MYSRSFSTKPESVRLRRFRIFQSVFASVQQKVIGGSPNPRQQLSSVVQRADMNLLQRRLKLTLTDMDQCIWLLGCELETEDVLVLCKCLEDAVDRVDRLLAEAGFAV